MSSEEKNWVCNIYDWGTDALIQDKLAGLDEKSGTCLICNLVCPDDYAVRKQIIQEQRKRVQAGIEKLLQVLDIDYCILAVSKSCAQLMDPVAELLNPLCDTMTMIMPEQKISCIDEHLKEAAVNIMKSRKLIDKKEFINAGNLSVNLLCISMETIVNVAAHCQGSMEDTRMMHLSGDGITERMIEVKKDDMISDLIPVDSYKMISIHGAMGMFVFPGETEGMRAGSVCSGNGNGEIYIYDDNNCAVDIAQMVFGEMYRYSCGKCALCREGLLQYYYILSDITKGKGTMEDMETLSDIFMSLSACGNCGFGKNVAASILKLLKHCNEEFDQHIQKKRCTNLRCKGMFSYYIKAEACDGCGQCMEACKEKTIDGAEGMIHIIREKSCNKCGICEDICPNKAVQRAGAVKPAIPEKLVPVGSFTSQKRGLMTRRRKR